MITLRSHNVNQIQHISFFKALIHYSYKKKKIKHHHITIETNTAKWTTIRYKLVTEYLNRFSWQKNIKMMKRSIIWSFHIASIQGLRSSHFPRLPLRKTNPTCPYLILHPWCYPPCTMLVPVLFPFHLMHHQVPQLYQYPLNLPSWLHNKDQLNMNTRLHETDLSLALHGPLF